MAMFATSDWGRRSVPVKSLEWHANAVRQQRKEQSV
jgi:hypothetical protein